MDLHFEDPEKLKQIEDGEEFFNALLKRMEELTPQLKLVEPKIEEAPMRKVTTLQDSLGLQAKYQGKVEELMKENALNVMVEAFRDGKGGIRLEKCYDDFSLGNPVLGETQKNKVTIVTWKRQLYFICHSALISEKACSLHL